MPRRRRRNTTGYVPGVKGGSSGSIRRPPKPAPPRGPQGPVGRAGPIKQSTSSSSGPVGPVGRHGPVSNREQRKYGGDASNLRRLSEGVDRLRHSLGLPTKQSDDLASRYILTQLNDLSSGAGGVAKTAFRQGLKQTDSTLAEGINEGVAALRQPRRVERLAKQDLPSTVGRQGLKDVAASQGALSVQGGKIATPRVRGAQRRLSGLEARRRRVTRPSYSGLDPEQSRIATKLLRIGDKRGATSREKLAAVETGLVESNLRNLAGGDRDSQGFRQERTSIYGTGPQGPRNVSASANRLYDELRSDAGTQSAPTPGLLAQAAQGSAFPERYDERAPEAKAIIREYQRGGKASGGLERRLQAARATARKLGLPDHVSPQARALGPPPKEQVSRFVAAKKAAEQLENLKEPYVYGGGHGGGDVPLGGGLDCSSSVSYVLNKMGALKGSLVSGDMGQALEPGPGAVTVYYNAEHTFMKIGNRYWGTSRTNPQGGPGFIGIATAAGEAQSGKYNVGHVPGLGRKVALQLGVQVDAGSGGGGVQYGAGGTTATVTGGSEQDKPGFSDSPILAVSPITSDLAAQAPIAGATLPGEEGGDEGGDEGSGLDIIENILRRRR